MKDVLFFCIRHNLWGGYPRFPFDTIFRVSGENYEQTKPIDRHGRVGAGVSHHRRVGREQQQRLAGRPVPHRGRGAWGVKARLGGLATLMIVFAVALGRHPLRRSLYA